MASIPSALETSFDPELNLLPSSRTGRSNTSRSANRERPEDQASSAPRSALSEGAQISAPPNRAVTFRLDRESDRFYIQVVDRSTGEVIRQIPPEGLLELAKSVGNLLNLSA